ncbi:MAG: hypothetical protein WC503_05925 [Candidatus Shapirobacteria bacterium]
MTLITEPKITVASNTVDSSVSRYTEQLKKFPVETISPGETTSFFTPISHDVLGFMDSDGQVTHISRSYQPGGDLVVPWLEENSSVGVKSVEITTRQRERMLYCMDILKMPPTVATYLTFDAPDRDLADFTAPGKYGQPVDADTPILLGLWGESGQGKSTAAAIIALTNDATIANFDVFSRKTSETYLKILQAAGLSKDSDPTEILQALLDTRNEIPYQLNSDHTFRGAMENLTNIFKGGNRPKIIICDFPGFVTDAGESRAIDIFDLAATYTISSIELSWDKQHPFEAAIRDYVELWRSKVEEMSTTTRIADTIYEEYIESLGNY